jgi:two-component system, cell cycle sensor histidine kinase and response regulator CckA
MSQSTPEPRLRILLVDDNAAIHEDFRKILGAKTETQSQLDDIEAELFGRGNNSKMECPEFRIDSAYQGEEALGLVRKASDEGDPYALAFVDVRMPPGWDGIETLERLWEVSPDLQAVICTAYSDYSWDDMRRRLGQVDKLVILKKPFETIEVLQLAHALTTKWILGRQAKLQMDDLDRMVRQRTQELVVMNENLQQEIADRTRFEAALQISEERFSKAFHASPIAMAIQSSNDRVFLDANQCFLALSGFTANQLLQHSDQEIKLWGAGDAETFSPAGRLRNQSCVLHRSDGTTRQTLLFTEPLYLGDIPCQLLLVEDLTDQLKLEAQLRQSQKMEVIGRMAAGVAHEFNNILTVIQGDVGLLQSAGSSALDKRALLDQIMRASQRAASFTKQLLAFSRKQVLQPRSLNLSSVVNNTKKMLARLVGERFEIETDCPEELPSVMADEGGMEQILINLMLNARDAMAEGGVIEISTRAVELDDDAAVLNSEARPGRFVCLTVADHGCGMDTAVIARIFDPFFTTKEVGKGTGLGLSTIHGIAKQHEGWVQVSSQIGFGSTFQIFLPVCESLPSPVIPETRSAPQPGKGETILVVEDESAVRELACEALQRRGYRVLQAGNGPEAIHIWESASSRVNLLLTDMVMPGGMSGGELAKNLLARNPRLEVIYTSGYSPEMLSKTSLAAEGINFLPKPYDPNTLLKAVRLCLDGGKLASINFRLDEAFEEAGV